MNFKCGSSVCNKLRNMAKGYFNDSLLLANEEEVRACLMTEDEIKKRASQQN